MHRGVHDRGRRRDRPLSEYFKRTVEAGYDRVAERYLASKDPEDPATLAALEELAGVPVTRWLAERFAVTGVDVSARQPDLARHHVPSARLVKADMTDLSFEPQSFDSSTP